MYKYKYHKYKNKYNKLKKFRNENRELNKDIENKDIENKDIENKDIENKDIENKDIENKDIENKDIENKDIENKDIENKDIENKDIENKDIENKDIENKDIENKDIENKDIENKDIDWYLFFDLLQVSKDILKLTTSTDVIILVGDTPSYLIPFLEKYRNTFNFAFSNKPFGCFMQYSDFYHTNIFTPSVKELNMYFDYLNKETTLELLLKKIGKILY